MEKILLDIRIVLVLVIILIILTIYFLIKELFFSDNEKRLNKVNLEQTQVEKIQ